MGQQVGKANIIEIVQPFVNLPRVACQRLWESFHDVAEGFGLQLDELQEICYVLDRVMATEKDQLDVLVEKLFRVLDTDENGLIDALETQVTLCALSSMSIDEKAEFMFNCFDFDESGRISLDETTLLFRQALSGAAKASARMPPHEEAVQNIAAEIFRRNRANFGDDGVAPPDQKDGGWTGTMTDLSKDENSYISKAEFVAFCRSSPEVASWIGHYDDLPDYFAQPTPENTVNFGDNTAEEGKTTMQEIRAAWGTDPEFGTMGRAAALPGGLGDIIGAIGGDGRDGGVSASKETKETKETEEKGGKNNKKKKSGQSQFVAVKPWLHTIESTVPSKPPPLDSTTPDSRLEMDWIYGYSSTHQRNNIYYGASGELIYPAAGVTV
jgi:Ca2+-binding EF-hand superfamily protein